MKKLFVLAAVLSFSLWSPSVVNAVLIDFDSLATGSYAEITISDVKFENNMGPLIVEDIGPLQPPFSEYAVIGPSSQTPGEWNKATFLNGISVYSVSVDMGDKGADFDTLVLEAYDSSDTLLARATMLNPNTSYSALTLSVSTTTPISYVLFNEQGNNNSETGYPGTAYFDNFRYDVTNGPDSADDFNDGIKDPAKWGTDEVKGRGQLNETNGRLAYTCGSKNGISSSDRPWKLTQFPYDAPWEIVIDATNTTSPTGKQWSSFGIVVENAKNKDDWIEVELAASEQSHMFWAEFYDNNAYAGDAFASAMSTSAPIRVSFDNITKVLTVSYFDGAVWNSLGTFGVNGSGGINGNATWGLTDSDHFIAYIFGYSENMTVIDGEIYGDNFQETGGVVPPPPQLSVLQGTYGTQITITGSGFGDKKGKVLMGGLTEKIDTWTDTSITLTVKKVPLPGETAYDVSIQPKPKGTPTFDLPGGFTVTKPYINPDTSDTHGAPGAEATIRGMWFGTKKDTVYVGQQKCKVTSWTMEPTSGVSEIVFVVHKKIGAGSYVLEVENNVGRSLSVGFTVP